MPEIRVLSTLAFAALLESLAPAFAATSGSTIAVTLAPTAVLAPRIEAGETGDVAILTAAAAAQLADKGILAPGGIRDLAVSTVGMAVRGGAPRPPIGDPASLAASLLAARTIGLSRTGASGQTMLGIFRRLGIAEAVAPRLVWIEGGYTGELAADGRAELAFQQVSELRMVPGIDLVGPVPPGLGAETTFAGGVFAAAGDAARAASLLSMIAAARVQLEAAGLTPL